jgi:hypothetical protein
MLESIFFIHHHFKKNNNHNNLCVLFFDKPDPCIIRVQTACVRCTSFNRSALLCRQNPTLLVQLRHNSNVISGFVRKCLLFVFSK